MAERTISGSRSLRVGRTVYTQEKLRKDPTLADKLNASVTPEDVKRLEEKGVMSGFKGSKKALENQEPVKEAAGVVRPQGAERTYGKGVKQVEVTRAQAPGTGSTSPSLPAGFPARAALVKAKLTTLEQVENASDEELLAISGIGDETLKQIRAQFEDDEDEDEENDEDEEE